MLAIGLSLAFLGPEITASYLPIVILIGLALPGVAVWWAVRSEQSTGNPNDASPQAPYDLTQYPPWVVGQFE
jgi:hypothetical protein